MEQRSARRNRVKLMLVDDNHLMLEGLQGRLEAHGVDVVGAAANGLEAIALARTLKPDVILMDIRMPQCDGLAATRRIKAEMPNARIIVLTTSAEDDDLFEAVKSGACGYLLKSMDTADLLEALEQVEQGTPPFSPGLAARLLDEFARVGNGPGASIAPDANRQAASEGGLNDRQVEVLRLAADGLSYKEIGARLRLSPRTVKYHMAEIMDRLHLDNRAQVLAFAGRMGWTAEKPSH
jgi:DNA-binding NarL/FixJ family response regulator